MSCNPEDAPGDGTTAVPSLQRHSTPSWPKRFCSFFLMSYLESVRCPVVPVSFPLTIVGFHPILEVFSGERSKVLSRAEHCLKSQTLNPVQHLNSEPHLRIPQNVSLPGVFHEDCGLNAAKCPNSSNSMHFLPALSPIALGSSGPLQMAYLQQRVATITICTPSYYFSFPRPLIHGPPASLPITHLNPHLLSHLHLSSAGTFTCFPA